MKKNLLLFCLLLTSLATVSAHPALRATISTALPSDTVCYGTSIAFNASPSTGSYGYIWNVNGSYVGTSAATYTATSLPTGVNSIYFLLTNVAGDTIYSVSDTLHITVDTLPVNGRIRSSLTPAALCVGDSLTLTDSTTGGTWGSYSPVYATISATGEVKAIAAPPGGGGAAPSVRFFYAMNNSCGSDTVRTRVAIASPIGPLTLTSNTLCIDSTLPLQAPAPGGAWATSDSLIGSLTVGTRPPFGLELTANATGTVTVYYRATNACGTYVDSSEVTVKNCNTTGVTPVTTATDGCNIYPNPATGSFTILANSANSAKANCVIYNMLGEKMKEIVVTTNEEAQVNVNLPKGVYVVSISIGDKSYTTRLVML